MLAYSATILEQKSHLVTCTQQCLLHITLASCLYCIQPDQLVAHIAMS
jgi:hypothetical protein